MGMPVPMMSAVAAGFAFTMLVASFAVHGGAFGAQHGGMEYPLTLAVISLALVLTGPGRFSADRLVLGRVRACFRGAARGLRGV